ncbi:quinoprotein glucose dehydrogenase [mine drainage metagenome]|uniref:Quinoprotein glucose dehydrogenase n=1 Tax=mine drainage metagenome TaxID=410659 RepID=A0A1J5SIA7_9ZZZZ
MQLSVIKHRQFISYAILFFLSACTSSTDDISWKVYGGGKDNIRYSTLTEIDTNNVAQLQKAWEYHSGDADKMTQIQVNPIVVDGVLFGTSPKLTLFAVDAATGKEKWVFNPSKVANEGTNGYGYFQLNVCRGVTYYDGANGDKRLFYAAGSNLFCINAATGTPIADFGDKGKIDLHNDLGRDVSNLYVATTSPGIIYKDVIIIGSRVAEEAAAAPGYIRAYDVHTGKLRWIFHTIPQPGEEGYDSWDDKEAWKHIGGANAWAGFCLDEEKGILFAPIGSASYDFYGGKRKGNDLYANCVVALNAATGKKIWHFQTVHHDVWDKDLPTAPALVTITKDGKKIEAIAQPTKTGFVFLLERTTGKPIYPILEKQVPSQSELIGEKLSATQPWPTFPEPFMRQSFTEKDINPNLPDSSYQEIKKRLASYSTGFMFDPPSKKGTVIFPGFDGGAEWGGPAFDPATAVLFVNANEMPWVLTMIDVNLKEVKNETNLQAGQRLYRNTCMACHAPQMQGGGNYPALIEAYKKYNEEQFSELLSSGRRMMPAFKQLSQSEKTALASFVLNIKKIQTEKFIAPKHAEDPYWKMPYSTTGYNKFLSKEKYPAIAAPWGTLNAIDLNSGKIIWKDTIGDYPELLAKGWHTGTENYGGPVVTAGGLVFIAATKDGMFRAFNKRTGKLLWQTVLPAPGFATPAIYSIKGKQYVVIACGGGKLGTRSGDSYVAFALP